MNALFFPTAARIREAQEYGSYGYSPGDSDDEEEEGRENEFRDAIAADNATFQSKDLALTSMDYFRWLRGDVGASAGLGGNRYLHETQAGRMM